MKGSQCSMRNLTFACLFVVLFIFLQVLVTYIQVENADGDLDLQRFVLEDDYDSVSDSLREWRSQVRQDLLDLNSPSLGLIRGKSKHKIDGTNMGYGYSLLVKGERIADYVPTPANVVRDVVASVKLKKGEVVYELGCGDAPFSIEAVREYHVDAICVENDKIRVDNTKVLVRNLGISCRFYILLSNCLH